MSYADRFDKILYEEKEFDTMVPSNGNRQYVLVRRKMNTRNYSALAKAHGGKASGGALNLPAFIPGLPPVESLCKHLSASPKLEAERNWDKSLSTYYGAFVCDEATIESVEIRRNRRGYTDYESRILRYLRDNGDTDYVYSLWFVWTDVIDGTKKYYYTIRHNKDFTYKPHQKIWGEKSTRWSMRITPYYTYRGTKRIISALSFKEMCAMHRTSSPKKSTKSTKSTK
jgi:hypothetical protein